MSEKLIHNNYANKKRTEHRRMIELILTYIMPINSRQSDRINPTAEKNITLHRIQWSYINPRDNKNDFQRQANVQTRSRQIRKYLLGRKVKDFKGYHQNQCKLVRKLYDVIKWFEAIPDKKPQASIKFYSEDL